MLRSRSLFQHSYEMPQVDMADDHQLLDSVNDSSLFDTYLIYGLLGTLIFIALIGVLLLLATSYCCLYSYFCCYRRHRHSSYQLHETPHEQQNQPKIACLQVHDSYPYLINQNPLEDQTFNRNYTTTNTKGLSNSPRPTPVPSVPVVQYDLVNLCKPRIHAAQTVKDCAKIPDNSRCLPSIHRVTHITDGDSNKVARSPCPNIYETVVPVATTTSSTDRATPIYEAEWTHNLKQIIMSKIPPFELPSLASTSSTHYFQQQRQQHSYDRFLANRNKASDSMRRNKMLKRLRDDAAFLY